LRSSSCSLTTSLFPSKDDLLYWCRRKLFVNRTFTHRINELLDILRKLKLVRTEEEVPSEYSIAIFFTSLFSLLSQQGHSYEALYLERRGVIEDKVSHKNKATIRHYNFYTIADIMHYWTELEYISLSRSVINDNDSGDEEEEGTVGQITVKSGGILPELTRR